jgi:Spy/CpxP family protein refolding chaperone
MRLPKSVLAAVGSAVLLTAVPAIAQQPGAPPAAAMPSGPGIAEPDGIPLPVVGVILDHEQELGLSASQVEALRRLGLDVLRATIRRQADLMVARVDLWTLLDREPDEAMDVAGAEAKIRETAQIGTDLDIAFLRAIEAAKSQLTPEQRSKLTALLAEDSSGQADPQGTSEPPGAARGAGHAPSGGAVSRPSGGRPPAGRPPGGGHVAVRPHFDHGRGFIGVGSFWWGTPYPYWDYPEPVYAPPPVVLEPPVYIQQEPPAYWYYCPSARGYYPSVPTCPEPWLRVAPTG